MIKTFPQTFTSSRPLSGFTLTELLIGIACIAVMASLLLGVVASARTYSRGVVCVSNLRALGVGFTSYAADHSNLLVSASKDGLWPTRIVEYVPRKHFFCPEAVAFENFTETFKNISKDQVWADSVSRISYGYNNRYLDPDFGNNWSVPRPREHITFTALSRLGSVMILADAGRLTSDRTNGWGFYVMEPPHLQYSMPLPRHRGQANILWADGHVSGRKAVISNVNSQTGYNYITTKEWDWRLQ